ncbi:hypothetical protein OQA88_7714 [Cercophora sp. LCS_1]
MAALHTISSINYTAPLALYESEKPFYSNVPAPDGRQSNQVAWTYPDILFQDIRDRLTEFDLDVTGFEIFQFGDGIGDETRGFEADAEIERHAYPVIERVLKARFGDVDVVIFDHTVRRRRAAAQLQLAHDEIRATRQPSLSAHCGESDVSSTAPTPDRCSRIPAPEADQTGLSGENRIKLHMGDRAPDLLKRRCRIIK